MFFNEQIKLSSATRRKGAIITFLFFLPSIVQSSEAFRHSHSVVINSFIALTGYTNQIFYPTLYMFMAGAGLIGFLVFFLTLILMYKSACVAVAVWEMTFDRLWGSKSRAYQVVALTILLIVFFYHAIYIPSLTASRFTVETNTQPEISTSADVATFYDGNGPFGRYVLQEFVVRNDNDFEMAQVVPQQAPVMCLYDTRSGALKRYGGYYADENGHGFVDGPNWNKLILAPQSESRYYLLGDENLSETYDEILLPKDSYWPPNKDCVQLTKEDIADGTGTIIKISR